MAIMDWPPDERPREKLRRRGARALSDAELVAIFLRTGRRGTSAVDLARELLVRFSGLRGLLDSDLQRLCCVPGLGPAKSVQLVAALELGRRYTLTTLERGDALTCPADTRRFLSVHLSGRKREVFACLFLDNRHRVIACEELFHGTIDGATVHAREVVKRTLYHNAAALILSHNHPSGVAEPSRADVQLTHRLRDALALIDVRILDHLVIGDGNVVSLTERGLI